MCLRSKHCIIRFPWKGILYIVTLVSCWSDTGLQKFVITQLSVFMSLLKNIGLQHRVKLK